MFGGLLDLRELIVSDVMLHRTEMVTADAGDPPEKVVEAVLKSPSSRASRCGAARPENIVGILHAKDLLRALQSADGDLAKVDVKAIARPAWFVPDIRPISEQLKAFRRRKTQLRAGRRRVRRGDGARHARGHPGGDRRRHHRRARHVVPGVRPQPDGSVNVDGGVPIRDLNRAMDWSLPDEEATTIAGLVIHEVALDPGAGAELHLPRLPLQRAAPRAQPHHGAAHHAAGAQAGEGGVS